MRGVCGRDDGEGGRTYIHTKIYIIIYTKTPKIVTPTPIYLLQEPGRPEELACGRIVVDVADGDAQEVGEGQFLLQHQRLFLVWVGFWCLYVLGVERWLRFWFWFVGFVVAVQLVFF